METYPPVFLPSSSPAVPFMAMNLSSHHRADSKVKEDDELVSSSGWFLELTPPSMGSHRALTTSNGNNVVEGSAGCHDSSNKSSVFEGLGIGEPTVNPGRNKGDTETKGKKARKQRYAFQTRSHVDILDDGYRWRKYGQKGVKNNKFPRSYYRCTVQGCNVKKQVQRLTQDEGIVVTTYEGIHSHSIERSTDNFEHILSQFQICTST